MIHLTSRHLLPFIFASSCLMLSILFNVLSEFLGLMICILRQSIFIAIKRRVTFTLTSANPSHTITATISINSHYEFYPTVGIANVNLSHYRCHLVWFIAIFNVSGCPQRLTESLTILSSLPSHLLFLSSLPFSSLSTPSLHFPSLPRPSLPISPPFPSPPSLLSVTEIRPHGLLE